MALWATSLGPKPPDSFSLFGGGLFFCFVLLFFFLEGFFVFVTFPLEDKKPVSLCVYIYIYISLSLSLSLSRSCLCFFLPCFLSFLSAYLFLLLFFLCHVSFVIKRTSNGKSESFFVINPFCFCSCLVLSFKCLSLIFVFLISSCVLGSTSMFLSLNKTTYKTPIFGENGAFTAKIG